MEPNNKQRFKTIYEGSKQLQNKTENPSNFSPTMCKKSKLQTILCMVVGKHLEK